MGERLSWVMCPVLGVRNVRGAVEHFADRLGFEVRGVFEGVVPDEGAVYGIVERGGAEIHLQIRRHPLWTGQRESIEGDVYVRVDDATRLHAELVRRGATILRPPGDQTCGQRDFVVEGPEGLRLSFGSPLGAAVGGGS
jgi:uncharacterized glyoxalase superfamily protein PhnB